MSRTGETKKKIIDLLRNKNLTMTDISERLELAPSTVTQHLQEMETAGAIKLVMSRRIKYYEINREPDIDPAIRREPKEAIAHKNGLNINKAGFAFGIVALMAVVGFLYYSATGSAYVNAQQVYMAPGSAAPSGSTVFSISDAPALYNITSLDIRIANISVHSVTTGKWYNIPLQNSTFDLIRLDNISSVVSGAELGPGYYNEIKLRINSIQATVNGTSKAVRLPNNSLMVFDNFNISRNGTTNWVNIDFDLADSLHIMENGSIIMLPVLIIKHSHVNRISLNRSYIIVQGYPAIEGHEFGMGINGTMKGNFTVPQNWSMEVNDTDGIVHIRGIMQRPFISRHRRALVIGWDDQSQSNGSNATEFNSTWSNTGAEGQDVWYNSTFPGRLDSNWSADINATFIGGRIFHSHCMSSGNTVTCSGRYIKGNST